jgi:hypothetical protein
MAKKCIVTFLFFGLFLHFITDVEAGITTLTASRDTYLTGGSQPNNNQGANHSLRIQHPSNFSHVLIQFTQSQIASAVGTGTLVSAKLRFYIETNFNNWGSGTYLDAHRLTADWVEMNATWNCANDTNLGNTNPDCSPQWNGGSYATPQTASFFQTNNVTGWIEFDVTQNVQAFLSGTSNFGWLIRKRTSTSSGSVDFTSREGTASFTPKLVLTIDAAPPTITGAVAPTPNAQGWNKTNATVTFTCSDPDGIISCTSPQLVQTEGANQVVTGTAQDT